MTKEEAREKLEGWIEHKMKYSDKMRMPIVDEVCFTKIEKVPHNKELGVWSEGETQFSQYTFKGLIKIAYDL